MATTYDNASLVMIPSGVKEDKLYSIKPTDGSGDFTFSRGSDIQATRVNSSGNIEKAKENLLTYSNTFSSWSSNTGVTETSGQSGYDGSSDAWKIDLTSAGGRVQEVNTTSGVHTFSVYAKAGSLNWLRLVTNSASTQDMYFDLANGVLGTSTYGGQIDATITSVGGDWYRCTLTDNKTLINVRIYPAQGDGDLTATSGNIYIQDAALCHGLIAQDYVETTTTAVVEGLTADLPRLDYSGGASCPSLLLEPSRTNKNLQSEYFNTWYTLATQTATDNAAVSPEGVQNATLLERTSSSGNSRLQTPIVSVASGASVVHSIFLKAHTARSVIMYSPQGGEGKKFDLTAGTAGDDFISAPDDYGIEPYADDWYRIWIVSTMPSINAQCWVYIDENDTTGFYAYGFQTEEGSYPTSYIPTYGTAANRAYDVANDLDLDGIFSGNSYTLLFDVDLNSTFNNKVFAEAKKATGSSSFTFRNFDGLLRVYNNLDSNYLTGSIPSDSNKWVVRIDNSTADIFSYNSGSPTKTNGTALTTIRDLGKISFSGGPTIFSLSQFLIFPTALTDSECNALVQ